MLVLQNERIIPPEQGIAMPEYLKFAATLWEIAITRLKETERAPADLFEKIVSI
jgi:hypothetical protein